MIPSRQGGKHLPAGVEVGHAALELVPSQEQEATGVRNGRSALLLTFIFVIDEQLSPVWEIPPRVSLIRCMECILFNHTFRLS